MSRFVQIVGFVVAAFAVVGLFPFAAADPPSLDLPSTSDPSTSPRVPASPALAAAVEQQIRDALDDELPRIATAGDGILDDVLGVIRERGSILDGSSLDPKLDGPQHPPENAVTIRSASHPAHVAEQLLRASRMLEKLGSPDTQPDTQRDDLVHRMRAEAAKLLSE